METTSQSPESARKSCCAPARGEENPALPAAERPVAPAGGPPPSGMVRLPGGSFLMGTDYPEGFAEDGEGPVREITLSPFWIDQTAVTNAQFARFVEPTGYKTDAERYGWSFVFHLLLPPGTLKRVTLRVQGCEWWCRVRGACWRHPEGIGTSIAHRLDHPVVHVSWRDAAAYAAWAGKRLPTEAEFEYAARGGLVQKLYPWGDDLTPGGEHRCNIWQGEFPRINTAEDGYVGTAPVTAYPPNGFGLYQMTGNVWEWCWDEWSRDDHARPEAPRVNPAGPPPSPDHPRKVMRGGSYLCHWTYCNRYRIAARTANTPDSSTGNIGFRCVMDLST
ncbi:MAG TPA: formylglycine-generating enzyme family protein [Candidatus Sumerlaeota bacterium]|nr:formylglycine-generating enzyme family protein [Candidatus Sumerlaeota bacterium]